MSAHAAADGDADGDDRFLALALSRANEAAARARAVLAGWPGPLDASVAHQVIGIVLREFGDIDAAVRELQTARRLALRRRSAGRGGRGAGDARGGPRLRRAHQVRPQRAEPGGPAVGRTAARQDPAAPRALPAAPR